MPATHRLILHASWIVALACPSQATAQAPLPEPTPSVPRHNMYHLALEDAKQRALATSRGLELANLGVQEKRDAIAARTGRESLGRPASSGLRGERWVRPALAGDRPMLLG